MIVTNERGRHSMGNSAILHFSFILSYIFFFFLQVYLFFVTNTMNIYLKFFIQILLQFENTS